MDPSVCEYWDLKTELAAGEFIAQHSDFSDHRPDEDERCKEETMLEDVQILLGLAISEHKQLKRKQLESIINPRAR
jgi:hypothetical protein